MIETLENVAQKTNSQKLSNSQKLPIVDLPFELVD